MTKNDIITVISARTGITKETVATVISEMNDTIVRALQNGESVKLTGFGTFYPAERNSRKGRNPKTGEIIEIPSRTITKFRPSKETKTLS